MYEQVRTRFHQTDYTKQICIGSEHTVIEWKCYCISICADYLEQHPIVLGGPGKTVEIDECLLLRRICTTTISSLKFVLNTVSGKCDVLNFAIFVCVLYCDVLNLD